MAEVARGADSPELERFKAQVVEVAQRYAREHDLCEVVDEALKEMGLDKMNEFTKVKVLVHVPLVIPVEVRAGLVTGLDDEATKAKLQELLAPVIPMRANLQTFPDERMVRAIRTARGRQDDRATPEVGPPAVIEVTEWNPDAQPTRRANLRGVPPGYATRYTGQDGRVQHYVDQRVARDLHGTALCGTLSYSWVTDSTRANGRVCARCAERARNR